MRECAALLSCALLSEPSPKQQLVPSPALCCTCRTGCLELSVPGQQHPDIQELLGQTERLVNSAGAPPTLASRAVQGIRALRFAVLRLHLAAWGPSVGLKVSEGGGL